MSKREPSVLLDDIRTSGKLDQDALKAALDDFADTFEPTETAE